MDIKHLVAFVAVVEFCSFTKAAHSLQLAQPTVTARIKVLERSLRTPLLHRTSGGVRLTPAGRRLYRYASRIVRLSECAQQAVCASTEPPSALVVGAAECVTTYRLVPLLEYMHLRHPGLNLSVRSLDGDPVSLVRDERIDCAFFIGTRTVATDVGHQLLCPEELALVAHPSHPLAVAPSVETAELARHVIACTSPGSGYQRGFAAALADAGAGGADFLGLGSLGAVKHGVAEGIGIALLPAVTLAEELRTGQLRRINWRPPFEVFAQCTWRPDLYDDLAFRALLDTALQVTEEQRAGTTATETEHDAVRLQVA